MDIVTRGDVRYLKADVKMSRGQVSGRTLPLTDKSVSLYYNEGQTYHNPYLVLINSFIL